MAWAPTPSLPRSCRPGYSTPHGRKVSAPGVSLTVQERGAPSAPGQPRPLETGCSARACYSAVERFAETLRVFRATHIAVRSDPRCMDHRTNRDFSDHTPQEDREAYPRLALNTPAVCLRSQTLGVHVYGLRVHGNTRKKGRGRGQ